MRFVSKLAPSSADTASVCCFISFALLWSYPPIYNDWTAGTVDLISIA
ncbi:MAG: hypothetical protein VB142_03610 [Burkholderia sp.]